MTTINCSKCGTGLTPQQAGEACPKCGSFDRNLTVADRGVATEKAQSVRELARRHFEIEPGMKQIFRVTATAEEELSRSEPIKLLEVNEDTVPAGALALGFDSAPEAGIFFPSVIMEVTPDEFRKIKSNELKLPHGWQLQDELANPLGKSGAA